MPAEGPLTFPRFPKSRPPLPDEIRCKVLGVAPVLSLYQFYAAVRLRSLQVRTVGRAEGETHRAPVQP